MQVEPPAVFPAIEAAGEKMAAAGGFPQPCFGHPDPGGAGHVRIRRLDPAFLQHRLGVKFDQPCPKSLGGRIVQPELGKIVGNRQPRLGLRPARGHAAAQQGG